MASNSRNGAAARLAHLRRRGLSPSGAIPEWRKWGPGQPLVLACPSCSARIVVDPQSPSHSIVSTRSSLSPNPLGGGAPPSVAPGIICMSCSEPFAFVNGLYLNLSGRPAASVTPPPSPAPPLETPVPVSAASEESLSSGSSQPDLEALPWTQLLSLAKKLGVPTRDPETKQALGRAAIAAAIEALY